MHAEASQSHRRPGPHAIFFGRVLARQRATLREFSAVFIIFLYLPKMTLLKDTCLTYESILSQLDERLGGPQKFKKRL